MNVKPRFVFFLCLLCIAAVLLSSCNGIADNWKIVRLTGEEKTVTVPLEDNGDGIGLSVDLNFTDGGSNTVVVLPQADGEAPYAVITYPSDLDAYGFSAVQSGQTLTVGASQKCQFTADAFSMTVYANVASYDLVGSYTLKADLGGGEMPVLKLHITGGAAVQMIAIAADAVSVHVDGAADVVLSGDAGKLDAQINGAGVLEASALTAQHGAITVNGVGAAEVFCAESLDAEINGAGSIRYHGSPSLTKTINGLGTVSQIPDDAT